MKDLLYNLIHLKKCSKKMFSKCTLTSTLVLKIFQISSFFFITFTVQSTPVCKDIFSERKLSYKESQIKMLQFITVTNKEQFYKLKKEALEDEGLNFILENIPKDPKKFYKERGEWKSWEDWLSAYKKKNQFFLKLKELSE